MHEKEKIEEAEYFYNQMLRTKDDPDAFKYNLSAFLGAARSVLQFAFSEAKAKSGGQKWYDSIIVSKPILLFFRDKRNVNIHGEPVRVRKDIHILLTETISISESITIVQKDEHGNIIGESKSEAKPPEVKEKIPAEITYKYKFDDWSGTEDIPTLCERYLIELKAIVADGQKKEFLS